MRCLYDTERDLIDRLHGTICRYDEKAVRVTVLGKSELQLVDPVSGKEVVRIRPNDELFDISSPEIGYLNLTGTPSVDGVYKLERNPYRKFRQGLYAECCSAYEIDGRTCTMINAATVFQYPVGLVDMIENRYPSFHEAVKMLFSEEKKEVAISKDIALSMMNTGLILIWCRGQDVAYLVPGSNSIGYKRDDTAWVIERMLKKSGVRLNG
jgi:hypothetical protein